MKRIFKIKILMLAILMNSLLFGQLIPITGPNMMSEAPVYEDANGTMYSTLVTFKFKYKMVNLDSGQIYVDKNKILYPAFKQLLNSLKNQYYNFAISKTFTDAQWADTLAINKRTNEMVKVNDLSQIYRIIFDSPVPTEQVVNILKTSANIEYAEGPIIAYETISPNDPWYSDNNYRWSFDVINAEGAWDITTGSPLIGIGMDDLFGGVPQLHEDLVGKVVWDNLNGNYGNHGIITAGVAGAATNNNMDIASLGWNVNLLLAYWDVNGIYELVRYGADII